jgi:hypothetical protein
MFIINFGRNGIKYLTYTGRSRRASVRSTQKTEYKLQYIHWYIYVNCQHYKTRAWHNKHLEPGKYFSWETGSGWIFSNYILMFFYNTPCETYFKALEQRWRVVNYLTAAFVTKILECWFWMWSTWSQFYKQFRP